MSLQPDQAPRSGLSSAHAVVTYLQGTDSPAGLQRRDTESSPSFPHSRCHGAGGVSPTTPQKGLPLLSSSWEAGGMEGRVPGICQGCGGRLWGQTEPHDTHRGRVFFCHPRPLMRRLRPEWGNLWPSSYPGQPQNPGEVSTCPQQEQEGEGPGPWAAVCPRPWPATVHSIPEQARGAGPVTLSPRHSRAD